jgi:putative oxidoreductase
MSQSQPSYAALLLRISTGILFIAHGLLKLVVFTPAGTIGYFQSLGLPGPLAYLIMALEVLGGLALLVGFQTRWLSLIFAVELIAAAIFGHAGNGWMFANTGGGWEFPVFWAVVMIALALLGDGAYALGQKKN